MAFSSQIYSLLSMTMLYVSFVMKKKLYLLFVQANKIIHIRFCTKPYYWTPAVPLRQGFKTTSCNSLNNHQVEPMKGVHVKFVRKRAYLNNLFLQFVVLLNVKACSLRSLMKEHQVLSVPGVWVNILLCERTTAERSDGSPPPVAPVKFLWSSRTSHGDKELELLTWRVSTK